MGRAPAYWSEENAKLIREKFVPVAIIGSEQARKDAVGQFCRDAGLRLDLFEGVRCCVTAGGKVLAETHLDIDLKKTLAQFQALPEAERAPGAVKVPDLGAVNAAYLAPVPPAGGLILKIHSRVLMHDGEKLRYVTGKDLRYDAVGKKSLEPSFSEGRSAAYQAQPDHMWLTEAEWKGLMPAKAKKGDPVPLSAAVANRILQWHSNPLRFYGRYTSDTLDRGEIRASELKLTVDAVSPEKVRLRLDGFAKFGKAPPPAVREGKVASFDQWGYEPQVLGFLEYDPRTRVFTQFDIVAIGDHFGRLGLGVGAPSRIGLQPLGFAFTLSSGEEPADRVPPGRGVDLGSYYGRGK